MVLEYYQPKGAVSDAIISIEYIVHGYRYINIGQKEFGDSGSCMVNVNCEDGKNWQNEKKAVAMIIVGGDRLCTGSLVNTTSLSQSPLLLTANHCVSNYGDAVVNPDLNHFTFYYRMSGDRSVTSDR